MHSVQPGRCRSPGHCALLSSAQLEASCALNGVEQLATQQRLVVELRELQQVHTGAGCGQPLQVRASIVNAECRVELLENRAQDAGVTGARRAQHSKKLRRERHPISGSNVSTARDL